METTTDTKLVSLLGIEKGTLKSNQLNVEDLECFSIEAKETLIRDLEALKELNQPIESLIKYIKIKNENYKKENNENQ